MPACPDRRSIPLKHRVETANILAKNVIIEGVLGEQE